MTDHEQPAAEVALKPDTAKLLRPGDRVKWLSDFDHYGSFVRLMDGVHGGVCWFSDRFGREHHSPAHLIQFVSRPQPPREDLGDGVWVDVEIAPTDAGGAVSEADDQVSHLARTLDKSPDEIRRALANLEAKGLIAAPQPLQQGGEVTRDWLVAVIKEHSFPTDAADMILDRVSALAADRDKAVGLLREVRETLDAIDCALTTDRPVAAVSGKWVKRIDAFLSSQTEER